MNRNFDKINSIKNKNHSSVFQILLKDKSDISKFKKLNNIDSKSEPFCNVYFKKKQELDLSKKLTNKNNNNSFSLNNSIKNKKKVHFAKTSNDSKSMSSSINNSINNKVSINQLETKKKEENYKPLKKQNFSWFNYFSYIITCKLYNPKISYYEIFRKEVISEENIIQSHINIFKLLKVCKIENLDPFKLKNIKGGIC